MNEFKNETTVLNRCFQSQLKILKKKKNNKNCQIPCMAQSVEIKNNHDKKKTK